jgi:hypothetical protein
LKSPPNLLPPIKLLKKLNRPSRVGWRVGDIIFQFAWWTGGGYGRVMDLLLAKTVRANFGVPDSLSSLSLDV